jgi:hypothetical protein
MAPADANELDDRKLDIELQKLKLERQRIALDSTLRRKEQILQRKQFEATARGWNKWNQILSPAGAAIFAGLVGLFGTVLNGYNNTNLERQKQQGTFILEAIKTGKEQTTAANLVFLADAGLIKLSKPELAKLREKAGGTLPSLPPIDKASTTAERNTAVSASDILMTLRESLKHPAEKEAATVKLKKIITALEKDKDIVPLLKAAEVSSEHTDGESMRQALINIRRSLTIDNKRDMVNKIDEIIIENGQ